MNYEETYRRSIDEPDAFWGEEAKRIHWHKPPQQVLDYSNPPFRRWFVGGETNLCYNAVDRHLGAGVLQAHARRHQRFDGGHEILGFLGDGDRSFEYDGDLTAYAALRPLEQLTQSAASHLLVGLGELSAHRGAAIGT